VLEGGFLGQPSYKRYILIGNDCIAVCKYLLDSYFLLFGVDRASRDTMDNNSVSWYSEFCMLSKASNPISVLLGAAL
jgi:hypothetical protein